MEHLNALLQKFAAALWQPTILLATSNESGIHIYEPLRTWQSTHDPMTRLIVGAVLGIVKIERTVTLCTVSAHRLPQILNYCHGKPSQIQSKPSHRSPPLASPHSKPPLEPPQSKPPTRTPQLKPPNQSLPIQAPPRRPPIENAFLRELTPFRTQCQEHIPSLLSAGGRLESQHAGLIPKFHCLFRQTAYWTVGGSVEH